VVDTAERYRLARERVTAIVETLDGDEVARPVPTCPGWTVHDLVAHLSGLVDDVLAGRLEGRGTPPWTAAQVERGRGVPVEELLAAWSKQAASFEQLRVPARVVIDIVTHEQDLRGAVERPGARDTEELAWAFDLGAQSAVGEVAGLRIETAEGPAYGPTDAATTLVGDRFELFRVFLGRRSAAQLQRLDWRNGMPPDAGKIMVFGPATVDIRE
jgi:uncharacterized protein (TIGR03083 family)